MTYLLAGLVALVVSTTTSAAVAQPAIGLAFGAGPADVAWVVFGYSASFAVATSAYAQFGARFGIGRSLAVGTGIVALGAAAAALAPSLPVLIVARILTGLGTGAIPTLTVAFVARRLEGPALARSLGLNVAGVGLGNVLGPLAGGLLLEAGGWRAALALGLLAAPAAVALWRADHGPGDRAASVDRRGLGLLALAVGGLVLALNRLPVAGLSLLVLGGTIVAVAGAVALARLGHAGRLGILPAELLRARGYVPLVATGAAAMAAFIGSIVTVPPAIARSHGLDGVGLGLVLVPMAVAVALTSTNGARLVPGGPPGSTIIAGVLLALGAGGLAVAGAGAPLAVLATALAILGIGFGILQAPLIHVVATRYAGIGRGVAVGLFNTGFFVGGACGGAIGSAFVQGAVEIGPLVDPVVPGFRTAMAVLALAPAAVALVLLAGRDRASG